MIRVISMRLMRLRSSVSLKALTGLVYADSSNSLDVENGQQRRLIAAFSLLSMDNISDGKKEFYGLDPLSEMRSASG